MFIGKEFKKSKKKVTSLEKYIEHIEYTINDIFNSKDIWFRGHSNDDYKLVPSILRSSGYDFQKEANVNKEFNDKAKGFIDNYSNLNKAELYYLMQHYGLKTRLLDWTEGSLIALFFSLKLSEFDNKHKDPCVWIINPSELNHLSVGKKEVIRINDDKDLLQKYFDNENPTKHLNPIAISSTYSNQRVLRQKGCFTVHRNDKGLRSLYKKANSNNLVKVRIDRKSSGQIIEQLNLAGVSESTIFPDLEGLTRELNLKHNL